MLTRWRAPSQRRRLPSLSLSHFRALASRDLLLAYPMGLRSLVLHRPWLLLSSPEEGLLTDFPPRRWLN